MADNRKWTVEETARAAGYMAEQNLDLYLNETTHGYLSGSYSASARAFKQMEFMLKDGLSAVEAGDRAIEWLKAAKESKGVGG